MRADQQLGYTAKWFAWTVAGCVLAGVASAQEPTGLQAALAIEQAMVDAIAAAENSVVSIARVVDGDANTPNFRSEIPLPFGPGFNPDRLSPTDPRHPDFVPNEFGTGVVIDADGYILTNLHICGDGSPAVLWITTVGRKVFRAEIVGLDESADLAVLRANGDIQPGDFTPIKMGDASALRKGQIVIALGNPYAIARDGQVSASWGIVSNLARKAPPIPDSQDQRARRTLHQLGTLIQTDAKLNLGVSGGALVNLRGEMIGLTTALAALAGYEQSAGYAIPVDETFRAIIDLLKRGKAVEYGMLGVSIENLTERDRARLGVSHGVKVTASRPGMPADRSGIRKDDIITHVGGAPIFDTDSLMLVVKTRFAATDTRLMVVRGDGRTHELRVRLAKFPNVGRQVVTAPDPSWRGLRVDFASVLMRPEVNPPMHISVVPSVLVSDVEADSPAWNAGLRRGMLISHVAGRPVEEPAQFYEHAGRQVGLVRLTTLDDFGRTAVVSVDVP